MAPRPAICRDLPGWRWIGDRLEPIDSVQALLERGARINGRCRTPECTRTVRVDLNGWWDHGYGGMGMRGLRRAYRCARIGCDLDLHPPFYESGVPLAHYLASKDRLDVRCYACKAGKLLTAEELIARLERAGLTYAGNAGVRIVGGLIRGACKSCGGTSWTVELKSPPAPGTPGYAKARGIGDAKGH